MHLHANAELGWGKLCALCAVEGKMSRSPWIFGDVGSGVIDQTTASIAASLVGGSTAECAVDVCVRPAPDRMSSISFGTCLE